MEVPSFTVHNVCKYQEYPLDSGSAARIIEFQKKGATPIAK
jgi:hypothetical protein